jgi:hypothetical protein
MLGHFLQIGHDCLCPFPYLLIIHYHLTEQYITSAVEIASLNNLRIKYHFYFSYNGGCNDSRTILDIMAERKIKTLLN